MKNTIFFLLVGLCFPPLAYSDTDSSYSSTVATPQMVDYVVPPPEVVAEREAQKRARAERIHRTEARSDVSSAHEDKVNDRQSAANTRQDDRNDAVNNRQNNQQERANDRQSRASQRRS